MQTILFRVDSGPRRGWGHLGRCLALAAAFKEIKKTRIYFLTSRLSPSLRRIFKSNRVTAVSQHQAKRLNPNWVVIDSYDLTTSQINRFDFPSAKRLVVDDWARRGLVTDAYLNPSGQFKKKDMRRRRIKARHFFLGPRFMPIRKEFQQFRHRQVLTPARKGFRLYLSVGGTKKHRTLISRIAKEILASIPIKKLDILMASHPKRNDNIFKIKNKGQAKIQFHTFRPDVWKQMRNNDFAVTGAGVTLMELCCLGVPSIGIELSRDQSFGLKTLVSAGACLSAGTVEDAFKQNKLRRALRKISLRATRQKILTRATRFIDGRGALRIARVLCKS